MSVIARFAALPLVLITFAFAVLQARDDETTAAAATARQTRTVVPFSFLYRPASTTESVFLLGDAGELGGNVVSRAIPMQTDDRVQWRLSVSLPADRQVTYGYWTRDHSIAKLDDPRNGTRVTGDKTIKNLREPRAGGKALLVHSRFDGPVLHWRQDDGAYERAVLEKVGPGRFAGEQRWRARRLGLANRPLQFFITDREQTMREPVEGVYETPLDRMFLQDHSLFTYVPAASVSPMRRDYDGQPSRLKSEALGEIRQYKVMLPRGYAEHTARRYPVLYFYDGQIIWDPYKTFSPWDPDCGGVAGLVGRGEVSEMILVAVLSDLAQRLREVTPPEDLVWMTETPGRADKVVEFITSELKPLIDSSYRTLPSREDTFITGFSGGGLLALYAGWEHHGTFGAVALQSAGLGAAPKFNARVLEDPKPPIRIYLDAGTRDGLDPAGDVFFGHSQRLWNDLLGDSPPAVLERDIRIHLGLKHRHDFADAGRRMRPMLTFLHPATLERDEELWRLTR